jgi:hypothetical protein
MQGLLRILVRNETNSGITSTALCNRLEHKLLVKRITSSCIDVDIDSMWLLLKWYLQFVAGDEASSNNDDGD